MHKSQVPYLFAVAYSLAASALVLEIHAVPPRFMDLFLVGIMFATLRWSWKPGAVIYVVSLATAAWILPPYASFEVSGGANQYRMLSYTVIAVLAMQIIERAKRGNT
jgi:hypothetical protein